MNAVPQRGQSIASSDTSSEHPLHGQFGTGRSITAVATGAARGAATTCWGAAGWATGAGDRSWTKQSVHQEASAGTAAAQDGQRTVVTTGISAGRRLS
jgi:hypothetical protein